MYGGKLRDHIDRGLQPRSCGVRAKDGKGTTITSSSSDLLKSDNMILSDITRSRYMYFAIVKLKEK